MFAKIVYANLKQEVALECPLCHAITEVKVDAVGFDAWLGGMLIQEALPEESPSTRETLISGLCPKCQRKLFGEVD